MASPTDFLEQNDTHILPNGIRQSVWVRETKLGNEKTIEVITGWQLSPKEQIAVDDSEGMIFLSVVGGQPPCEILGGDPVQFEGQNRIYTHPECRDLPVYVLDIVIDGRPTIKVTSAWQLAAEWREQIKTNGGVVFLRIIGGQPSVEVSGINPIKS